MNPCPLCAGRLRPFAGGQVLGSRDVTFVRCEACGSVILPEPDWPLDVGLLERCVQRAQLTTAVLTCQRLRRGRFLDFAGGYGTLTRFMRDRGYDFRHDDPYCGNIFAQGFDGTTDDRHDLVTAFEVLEHLSDPVETLGAPAGATRPLLRDERLSYAVGTLRSGVGRRRGLAAADRAAAVARVVATRSPST